MDPLYFNASSWWDNTHESIVGQLRFYFRNVISLISCSHLTLEAYMYIWHSDKTRGSSEPVSFTYKLCSRKSRFSEKNILLIFNLLNRTSYLNGKSYNKSVAILQTIIFQRNSIDKTPHKLNLKYHFGNWSLLAAFDLLYLINHKS